MNRIQLISVSILLLAGSAQAQDAKQPTRLSGEAKSTPIEKSQLPDGLEADQVQINLELRNAMNQEITDRLAVEKAAVEALVDELGRAVSGTERQAIQLRIHETKQATSRDLLGIQLTYAQRGGFTEQATQLQERITRLEEGLSQPQQIPTQVRNTQNKGGK